MLLLDILLPVHAACGCLPVIHNPAESWKLYHFKWQTVYDGEQGI